MIETIGGVFIAGAAFALGWVLGARRTKRRLLQAFESVIKLIAMSGAKIVQPVAQIGGPKC